MNGEIVSFPANGRTVEGYLSLPKSRVGPGVIVLQEYWGLVDHIKVLTDRIAAAGYVSLAPDLYHGEKTTSPDKARKMLMALNIAETGKDLGGALTYLRAHAAVAPQRTAVLGFCMGGQLALYAGQEHQDLVAAVVDFYGIHPNVTIVPARLRAPVLGHFAKHDESVPLEAVHALAAGVRSAGGSFELHEYDANHAFFNDTRPSVYDEASATLAWERTLAFFKTHLR